MEINLSKEALDILNEVFTQKEFYPPLSESPQSEILRSLSRKKLIRWCPYPEEFYIITPEGIKAIEGYQDD